VKIINFIFSSLGNPYTKCFIARTVLAIGWLLCQLSANVRGR